MPDPDFRRIDAMPVGPLAGRKKKQDGTGRAPAAPRRIVPPHLTVMAAFWMGLKAEHVTNLRFTKRRVSKIVEQGCHRRPT